MSSAVRLSGFELGNLIRQTGSSPFNTRGHTLYFMAKLTERITVNLEQCGGRACIRGMRIRVIDILELYAAGLSAQEILNEMPDLEMDDLIAALTYTARRLHQPFVDADPLA
jgi:uncharacterized protein (DUF433 family)